jgi:hypothetical protein
MPTGLPEPFGVHTRVRDDSHILLTFFENGVPVFGDVVEVEGDDADGYADTVEIED